ncbi:MAG: hypothetical protein KA250_18250 [Verrucomicrobiales bacterium]|nr:hypothetical protein [Verrucomicrobiales bacterium]MBP9225888.1 hypothetical protein [Verrucomicrobiales bacterium]HQZ27933.1 hypothetical protein [Verrucomicrobiales bacterium]
MKSLLFLLLLGILFPSPFHAEEGSHVMSLPSAVAEDDFRDLKTQSPFLRSVNLSDSLILTGLAMVNEEQVATLMNRETKETFVVSSKPNSQGWKMVELKADADLEKVAAKVAIEGGEVVTVRYSDWQLKPGESKPGAGPVAEGAPGGSPGGGEKRGFGEGRRGSHGGPSPEFREKMSQLSEDQRGTLFQKMSELREKNPEMSREDRTKQMSELMDRMMEKK